jgi:hypothetical protein
MPARTATQILWAITLAVLTACGRDSADSVEGPRRLDGRMTVRAEGPVVAGEKCVSDADRPLTIQRLDGTVLATPDLIPGPWTVDERNPTVFFCGLTFTVELPELPEYRVYEGEYGDVVSSDWLFERPVYGFGSPAQFYGPKPWLAEGSGVPS